MNEELIGIIAGIVNGLALLNYMVSIIRRRTVPTLSTWVMWTGVAIALYTSYEASGAEETIWIPLIDMIGITMIMLLAVKYGRKKFDSFFDLITGWTAFELACFTSAITTLLVWKVAGSSPKWVLWVNLFIDTIAAFPTSVEVLRGLNPRNPEAQENSLTWTLFLTGNALNLGAISNWSDTTIVAYPVTMVMISLCIALPVWFVPVIRRRRETAFAIVRLRR